MKTLLLLLCVLVPSLSHATTYWVRGAGPGTPSTACASIDGTSDPGSYRTTIVSGLSCLTAGDTLMVKAGTYQEALIQPPSGNATNRITIQAVPGETVTVQNPGTANVSYQILFNLKSYITIDGLILNGQNEVGFGISFQDSHHIRLQNMEVGNNRGQGILLGTAAATDNCEFFNLNVHHNGSDCDTGVLAGPCHGIYFSGTGHLFEGGIYHHNSSAGIVGYSNPTNATVRKIRSYNNGQGFDMIGGSGNKIYNNIAYNNSLFGVRLSSTGVQLFNNTIYANPQGIVLLTAGSMVVRNNIVHLNGTNINGTNATMSNNLTVDPKFINAGAFNFQLQPISPAINAGTSTAPTVTTDFLDIARPNGTAYDIGAYEYVPAGGGGPTGVPGVPYRAFPSLNKKA